MTQRFQRGKTVVRAIVTEVRAENITFMAGSIAYHAFVSLLPFLLLVLFLVTRIGGEATAQRLIEALAANITPGGGSGEGDVTTQFVELLVTSATSATRNAGLSVLSLAALVWGTLRIFRGLDQAFSDIYESEELNPIWDQILDGVVVFGAIGVAIFVVTIADEFVGIPSFGTADAVVRPLLSVLSIGLALLPMYYFFPDEDVSVREVLPGTLLAGTGWTALSYGFGFYTGITSKSEWGVVGAIILLITWLYFGGLVLLAGAAVNAVLAGRSEDVANIAWDPALEGDATANDDPFVERLRELEAVDWEGEVRIVVDDADVTVPPPDEASVTVTAVDRPRFLGGDRETGAVVLRWDSRN